MTCSQRRAYRRACGQTTPGTESINGVRARLAALTSGDWVVSNSHEPVDGRPRPDARAARDAREALASLHPARRGVSRNKAKARRKQTLTPRLKFDSAGTPYVEALPLTRRERNAADRLRKLDRRSQYVAARRAGLTCENARKHAGSIVAIRDYGRAAR